MLTARCTFAIDGQALAGRSRESFHFFPALRGWDATHEVVAYVSLESGESHGERS